MRPQVTLTIKMNDESDVVLDFDKLEDIDSLISTLVDMREDLESQIEEERQRRREKRKRRKERKMNQSNFEEFDVDEEYRKIHEEYENFSPSVKEALKPVMMLVDKAYKSIKK